VAVRTARVNQILGVDVTSETVAQYCSRLQLPVVSRRDTQIDVEIPSFRRDLVQEIDLIEEVGRLHSYQEIPTSLPTVQLAPVPRAPQREAGRRALDVLLGCGYTQVINYSFMNEDDLDRLQLPDDDPLRHVVPLRNPLSKEAGVLRTTLIPSLLRTVSLNVNRDSRDLMLCELSKVFRRQNGALPQEPQLLTLAVTGQQGGQHWAQPARALDFFDLIGALEMITERLRLPHCRAVATPVPYCHPGKAALMALGDEPIGVVGEIHPTVLASFDLSQPVTIAEVDFDRLIGQGVHPALYRQVPRFPSVTRDLSLIVDAAVGAGQILTFIRGFRPDLLRTVRLFDVYVGTPVPSGKKSLTFALTYRADDRTLTDDEVHVIQAQVVEELRARFGGQLRA
jgi:phenylalanyl-tRNA synthetase beta chain